MLGALDVGTEEVESVESLVQRGREVVQYLPPTQLIFGTDCGMIELSREAARQKLINMAAAVAKLNEEI